MALVKPFNSYIIVNYYHNDATVYIDMFMDGDNTIKLMSVCLIQAIQDSSYSDSVDPCFKCTHSKQTQNF